MTVTPNGAQLDSFLNYYRSKLSRCILVINPLATFEDERLEWLQQAEALRHLLESTHSKESELAAKKTEIAELQKMLSDARIAVHDERQQYMKIKRDHNVIVSK
jgi:hypothetical protein